MKVSLNAFQITFIVIAAIIVVVILLCAIFIPLRFRYKKKKYKDYYYRKIYSVAFNKDYYLINDFMFKIENSQVAKFDHILFGDKYIYLIHDYYYSGDLSGNVEDESFVLTYKDGKKIYIDNPFKDLIKLLDRLSMTTEIDKNMMIGIILVNDNCRTTTVKVDKNKNKQFYIIQRKKFKQLIKAVEERPVGKMNADALDKVVKAFDKLNRRKKSKSKNKNA